MEKNKILSKLNIDIKDYNNELEKILENKLFSYEVKNLLLSMLYKIENAYKDYETVKVEVPSKRKYIENLLRIIKEKCLKIFLVKTGTQEAKELEKDNMLFKVDRKNGEIICFQNEFILLTAIFNLDISPSLKELTYGYIEEPLFTLLKSGEIDSNIELIRDFNGWSWDIDKKEIKDIEYNYIYQTILLINGRKNINNKKQKKIFDVTSKIAIKKNMLEENDTEYNEKFEKIKKEKEARLELFNDKRSFINQITEEKKEYTKEIEKIDKILNNNELLKKEYNTRNEKLPNKEKIFSISHLSERLEKEREVKLEEIKQKNKMLEPLEFIKLKEQNEEEIQTLQTIIESIDNQEKEKETVLKAQTIFLNNFLKEAEMANKEKLLELIYKFRYYCLIPVTTDRVIKDIPELQKQLKDVTNCLIDNGIDKEIIVNFSDSTSVCYNILKYVFVSKIINLQEIEIVINKVDNKKQENDLDSKIKISIYDLKDKEKTYEEIVKHLKLVKVKFNKKIKVFL